MSYHRRVCLLLLIVSASAMAQTGPGSISGTVSDPNGGAVPTASVQAKNVATGSIFKAISTATGGYTIASLPAGTYDLTIPPMGFMFAKFEQKGVTVQSGAALHLDLHLDWPGNLGTIGDDVTIIIRSRSPAPSGPTPRTADGKPDLSGVWVGENDPDAEQPVPLPWADAVAKARRANGGRENPSGFCLPGDVLLRSPFVYKLVQTPSLIVVLWEDNLPGIHQIFMDGRSHPKEWNPNWMGHSIGHWEGDTLVEDVVGFNDRSWIGVFPHTEMLHVVSRYRRPDLGHLEKEITVDDPGTFAKPWKVHLTWNLAPGEDVMEEVCENNRDAEHLSSPVP